uniref:Uncharacterized protein n=1 Tax=Anopheles atroparvus TaxID=41427 RepID=A0A182JIS2_ANOAO
MEQLRQVSARNRKKARTGGDDGKDAGEKGTADTQHLARTSGADTGHGAFVAERAALLAHDGAPAVTADNLVEQLLHSPARWKTISELARRIMTVRQRRWQQDQATEAAATAAEAEAAEAVAAAAVFVDAEAASAVAATSAETV